MTSQPEMPKAGTSTRAYQRDIDRAREEGFNEGLKKGRGEILDFLQYSYLEAPDRPDRGTPKAEAILEVARDAQAHFNPMPHTRALKRKRGKK